MCLVACKITLPLFRGLAAWGGWVGGCGGLTGTILWLERNH